VKPGAQIAPLAVVKPAGPSGRVGPWVLIGTGAALVIGGAISQGLAAADYGVLKSSQSLAPMSEDSLAASGKLKQALGLSLLSTGAVAVAGGFIWFMLGRDQPTTGASLWFSNDAAGLAVSGSF